MFNVDAFITFYFFPEKKKLITSNKKYSRQISDKVMYDCLKYMILSNRNLSWLIIKLKKYLIRIYYFLFKATIFYQS